MGHSPFYKLIKCLFGILCNESMEIEMGLNREFPSMEPPCNLRMNMIPGAFDVFWCVRNMEACPVMDKILKPL